MRVLWVYKVFDVGGAEQLLLEVLPHLAPHVAITPVAVDGSTGAMAERYVHAGLSPVDLCSSGPYDVAWTARFRRLVRRLRADLVHFHSPLPAALGRPAMTIGGVPTVYTEHNIWPNYVWATRWANIATYRLDRASIAVSEGVRASQRRSVARWFARETRVIRNGIDADAVRRDASPPADFPHPTYGAVGHLRRYKGIDVLLEAARLISAEISEARGIVVGGGEDEGALRDLRGQLGLTDTVDFLGVRPDARRLMGGLDVFVVPSRQEGLPVALLEAMALERAVVATSVGGVPEVVQHEVNGIIVPPEDPGALAASVLGLLRDRDLAQRLGSAASRTVEERFSSARMAEELVQVYRQVLSGPRR